MPTVAASDATATSETTPALSAAQPRRAVTARALFSGLILAAGLAGLNCWIETRANVHFLGGVQMPFGAVFVVLFFVLAVNYPLRALHRFIPSIQRVLPVFSAAELLTIYAMLLFAALISTAGCDNFFITTGPALFYFSTPENGWANLFYKHVPPWFSPGWNGHTYQQKIIKPMYEGGLDPALIPWHAWTSMIIAWGAFLLLVYAMLFFVALMLRRQWVEHEALAFPLVQLPLQMVEVDPQAPRPEASTFWSSPTMWTGFAVAAAFHLLRGLNAHYPDWPNPPLSLGFQFTETPWDAMGGFNVEFFFGGLGVAYLLTREISLSFWFFFVFQKFELTLAQQLGFSPVGLPKDTYMGRPTFITFQSIGGWVAMAALLLWTARRHLWAQAREAWYGTRRAAKDEDDTAIHREPFSARFVLFGFLLSLLGLLGWSWFAGIHFAFSLAFLAIYLMTSVVLARVVIEGGFLFPQIPFSPLEWMTTGLFGTSAIGAATLTKFSFLQPMLMSDMRTNVLPGFLHTMKIAEQLQLGRRDLRRLLLGTCAAIVVALVITIFTSIYAMYAPGNQGNYGWFTQIAPRMVFDGTASMIKQQPSVTGLNLLWTGVGAGVTMFLTLLRSRYAWFPLHPLGYIIASGGPISRLWFSFFLGWLIKTLIIRFCGNEVYITARPFMIGLIFGNLSAMMFWMLVGFRSGVQMQYFPA